MRWKTENIQHPTVSNYRYSIVLFIYWHVHCGANK